MATLADLVIRTRTLLGGQNRDARATFVNWVLDGGSNKIGINLADYGSSADLTNALVELDTELLYVSSLDESTSNASCPPWFRQQRGTPLNNSFAVNSAVTINPDWPTFTLSQAICDGINTLYPSLYNVKVTSFDSVISGANYELPADCEAVLDADVEGFGPDRFHYTFTKLTTDILNVDGLKYMRILPMWMGGRPIEVKYKARPVTPDPANLAATWASTGLPDSAQDLPVLYAAATLISTADASKTQTNSVEQSDRNRFVQGGSANSTGRRFQELYTARLREERKKLLAVHDGRVYRRSHG